MTGNERHYEEVSVKQGGKRRMEGQVKGVFRAWMSRQPYANVTECVQKLSVFLSLSHNMMGTLHSCMMRLADGMQIKCCCCVTDDVRVSACVAA